MNKSSNNTSLIIGIVAVAAVVVIGGWLLLSNRNTSTESTTMNSSPMASEPAQAPATRNIVEIASNNPQFSTLVTAVKTAGLVDTLSGTGPFTVFAPTNDAFAKLPAGTLDSLLKDPEKLKQVLTYHVVSGNVKAADVVKVPSVTTVNGKALPIVVEGSTVKVGPATVVSTDIAATNGTIHVIDTVLVP